jgi:hypothetical protein
MGGSPPLEIQGTGDDFRSLVGSPVFGNHIFNPVGQIAYVRMGLNLNTLESKLLEGLKEGSKGHWNGVNPPVLHNRVISEKRNPYRLSPFGKLLRSLLGRLKNLFTPGRINPSQPEESAEGVKKIIKSILCHILPALFQIPESFG